MPDKITSLGIMQPYFFPYIGYFSLIKSTSFWVVFDQVQFIRHGWIERNRILGPSANWQYIKVPLVKHSRDTLIREVEIRNTENWKQKIFGQLTCYKKKAPYYNQVLAFLENSFKLETNSITKLNAHLLNQACLFIGLDFSYQILSEMDIEMDEVQDAGEWALNISKALGAKTYINPMDGMPIFDSNKFQNANIELLFLKSEVAPYDQKRTSFEPGLSIIDVMMFNSPEEILKMIDSYTFINNG